MKWTLTIAMIVTLGACASQKKPEPEIATEVAGVPAKMATAVLKPTSGSSVSGTIRFTEAEGGVQVDGEVQGLDPSTEHGFHIHEKGDCSAEDGTSAGGHFNPEEAQHGAPGEASHVGDLGNINADDLGKATVSAFAVKATLSDKKPGLHSIIKRGVIVHAGKDDLNTQPTGAAGARIACGVIELTME